MVGDRRIPSFRMPAFRWFTVGFANKHVTTVVVLSIVVSGLAVAAASAPTAQRLPLSGAILRYLRVSSTGTFSNLDFCMVTRRGTAQDDVSLNP